VTVRIHRFELDDEADRVLSPTPPDAARAALAPDVGKIEQVFVAKSQAFIRRLL
jgi:hypothetical protein